MAAFAAEAADDAPRPRIEVEWDLGHGARLQRHPWSRMAWRRASKGARLYAGGQAHALPVRDAQRLAAANEVDGTLYDSLSAAGRDVVFALLAVLLLWLGWRAWRRWPCRSAKISA